MWEMWEKYKNSEIRVLLNGISEWFIKSALLVIILVALGRCSGLV